MKKTILILATAVFALGFNSCIKKTSAPVADFSYSPSTIISGQTVTFTDNSSNGPTTWAWNPGDGGIMSPAQSTTHLYSKMGSYGVTLTVTNSAGSNSITKQINVQNSQTNLVGKYSVTGTLNSGTYTITPYTCNITVSATTDGQIIFDNFGGWGSPSAPITAQVTGNYFTFSGTINAGSPSVSHQIISGTGTISGTTLTLSYTDGSNYYLPLITNNVAQVTETYVKQ